MKNHTQCALRGLAALIFGLTAASVAIAGDWEQIYLDGPIMTVLPDGSSRELHPLCSGGPELTATGPVPASTEFYFFVQQGDPRQVLFGLDGGGACWDAATCVGSALAGDSTYTIALDETPESLADAEGFFDTDNADNPFKDYTKIFIPYCTADVHWGSKDTTYVLELGPGVQLPWVIHHRGMDNLLAVLDWLQNNGDEDYEINFGELRDVTVAGASAGGYGATVAFPYVAELTPKARLNLIADAAIGVLTSSFYKTAIYDAANPGSESWGVEQNLPPWVPGFDGLLAQGAALPNGFAPSVFAALARYKPRARMASLTTNLDLVQISFYLLMQDEFPPVIRKAAEWYFLMTRITAVTASLPNYRFFIDNGTFHTFLATNEAVYGVGANGVALVDWVRAMITPGDLGWDNLDAGPPCLRCLLAEQ